jgi:hypothetical protein
VDWIDLALIGVGCRALVNAGMKLRVLKIVGEFMARSETSRFYLPFTTHML